jgi:hypothetical protein
MNMNFHTMADGNMIVLIVPISGYPIVSVLIGNPIIMDVGYGIPTMAMFGVLLIRGDILLTIMADGIGTPSIIGIGYLVTAGLPPGYHGSGMTIITGGVP